VRQLAQAGSYRANALLLAADGLEAGHVLPAFGFLHGDMFHGAVRRRAARAAARK